MATQKADAKRVDRRIVRTKQRVLDAAVAIATADGLSACTMQTIAERSGVARSTIYRHWDGPTSLLVDALETISTPPQPASHDADSSLDEILRSIAGGLSHALTATPWGTLVAELIAAAPQHPEIEDLLRRFVDARLDIGGGLVAAAQQRGEISTDVDPEYLLGLVVGPIYYRYLVARQDLTDQWIDAHVCQVNSLLASKPQ